MARRMGAVIASRAHRTLVVSLAIALMWLSGNWSADTFDSALLSVNSVEFWFASVAQRATLSNWPIVRTPLGMCSVSARSREGKSLTRSQALSDARGRL